MTELQFDSLILQEKSSAFGGMFKGWTKGTNTQSQVLFCCVSLMSPGTYSIMYILCIYSIQMNILTHWTSFSPRRICLRLGRWRAALIISRRAKTAMWVVPDTSRFKLLVDRMKKRSQVTSGSFSLYRRKAVCLVGCLKRTRGPCLG